MAISFRFAWRFFAACSSCALAQYVSVKLPGTSYGYPSPAPGGKYIIYMGGHYIVPEKPQEQARGYFYWPGLAPYGECGMFQIGLGYGSQSNCQEDQWCILNMFSKCPGKGYCSDPAQVVYAGDQITWYIKRVSGMAYQMRWFSSRGAGSSMTQSCVGELPVDAWSMDSEMQTPYNRAAMPSSSWTMWGLSILDNDYTDYADNYQVHAVPTRPINCYKNQCTMSFNPSSSYAESLAEGAPENSTILPPITDCKKNKLCEDFKGYIPGRVNMYLRTGRDLWEENLRDFPGLQNQGPPLNVSVIKEVTLDAIKELDANIVGSGSDFHTRRKKIIVGSSMSPQSLNEQSSEARKVARKHAVTVDAAGDIK